MKGGCDAGEARAVEGEVGPALLALCGRKGAEQVNRDTGLIHIHTPSHQAASFNSGGDGALGISRRPFPRHNTRVGCRLLTFTLQLWASVWDGSRCLEVVAGGRQKDELGQHCSLPKT